MSVTVVLMRHGEPEGGKRFRGHSIDDPLSDKGWQQMREAPLNADDFDAVVTSPLLRCHEFAQAFSQQQHIQCQVIDDLKEIGFGHWEGKSRAIVRAIHVKEYALFYASPEQNTPKNAEQLGVFYRRILAVIKQLKSDYEGQTVLVVAHAGVIRAILAYALDTPLNAMFKMQISNASLIKIDLCDESKVYF